MKIFTKIISLCLCAVLLLGMFSACNTANPEETEVTVDETPIMTMGNYTINKSMYQYLLASFKTDIVTKFGFQDIEEDFWSFPIDDKTTLLDYFTDMVNQNIMTLIISQQLFEEAGLTFTQDDEKAVEERYEEAVKAAGGEKALSESLKSFNLTLEGLREIYNWEQKIVSVYEYNFGENGANLPTDEEKEEYYNSYYTRVKLLTINTDQKVKTDENGMTVFDEEKGGALKVDLTAEERQAKLELAAEIEEKLDSGTKFDALMSEYNEDKFGEMTFADGYYLEINVAAMYPQESIEPIFDMKPDEFIEVAEAAKATAVGDVELLDLSENYGKIYFLKRYALIDGAYKEEMNYPFFAVLDDVICSLKSVDLYKPYQSEITFDTEAVSDLKLNTCPDSNY